MSFSSSLHRATLPKEGVSIVATPILIKKENKKPVASHMDFENWGPEKLVIQFVWLFLLLSRFSAQTSSSVLEGMASTL